MFIRGLSVDWNEVGPDSYLRDIAAINELDYLPFRKPITFFVGENGSGKSTLLEAIAIAYGFNPEGGSASDCIECKQCEKACPQHLPITENLKQAVEMFGKQNE